MTNKDHGEWIEWNGGPCPIENGMAHMRRYRDGSEEGLFHQGLGVLPSVWQHRGDENDIIAYRVVKQP